MSPKALRLGGQGGEISYELADDLIAAHGIAPGSVSTLSYEGGQIGIEPVAATAREDVADRVVGPVYRRAPGGELAVPTGRALVRFAEGSSAAEHQEDLGAAGYRLDQVLPYAPHAAWVRASEGGVVDTLRHLDRLERLPGVEHVEPQLLTVSARRA